jgi:hypothetical protein
MPYTTKEIVKKHILDHHIGSIIVHDERLQLNGTDSSRLQRRMLLPQSEIVKAREMNEPFEQNLGFGAGDQVTLSHGKLIPDSVVVANDSSLGRIYSENVDYHIDYDAGTIRRLSSGSIPTSSNAVIWYLFYRVYQRGVDYDIDYQNGSVKRRNSGAIESGQWVLLDYTSEFSSLDDAAIDNAIGEANAQILSFIDSSHRESNERALVIAETYLAVSVICRIRGMESISPSMGKAGADGDARSWAAISEMYRKEAYSILAPFAATVGAFKPPSKA